MSEEPQRAAESPIAVKPQRLPALSFRTESSVGLLGLVVLIALGAGSAWLTPALPDEPRLRGAGATQPRYGGTLVVFQDSDIRSLDPHIAFDVVSSMGTRLLFEGLVEHDRDQIIVPRLARTMPTISEDGRQYRFELRPGVRFHNGRELVAEDVRWSIEHVLAPSTGSPGVPYYSIIDGVEEFRDGTAPHVRGIRVVDRYIIDFVLKAPDQTFLHAMAMQFAFPVPRENYEAHPTDVREHPIGTGAFVLDEWEPGVRISFRKNEHFYRDGEPYVDRIVAELNLDRDPAFMRFENAQIDIVHRLTASDLIRFSELPAWEPYRALYPGPNIWGINMNCEIAPFDDVHVRRAVAFAIRRDRWVRARANQLIANGQPIPGSIMGYREGLENEQHYDIERARHEMELAGHRVECEDDGERETCRAEGLDEPIELWLTDGPVPRIYAALALEDLRAIGLPIRIRHVSFPVYLEESGKRGTVALAMSGWSMDYPDPSSFLDPLFHSRSIADRNATNRSFYANPEVDRLLDAARAEASREERIRMYERASSLIAADAPWAFLFSSKEVQAWQPYVRNYRPDLVWTTNYRDVWLDLPASSFEDR